jgi:hypothetical protein
MPIYSIITLQAENKKVISEVICDAAVSPTIGRIVQFNLK